MAEPNEVDYGVTEQPPNPPGDDPAQAGNGFDASQFEHELSKPIQAHGDEVRILKWREPTAGDIERAGNPIVVDMFNTDQPRFTFDERKMSAMIAVLCQIPPSSVKQIPSRDWTTIAWKLTGFFMPRG